MSVQLDNILFPQIHSFKTEDEAVKVLDIASAVVEKSEIKNKQQPFLIADSQTDGHRVELPDRNKSNLKKESMRNRDNWR